MANEITLSGSLSFTKNGATQQLQANGTSVSPAEVESIQDVGADIPTTDTVIDVSSLTAPGWLFVANRGANDLLVGSDGTNYPIKVPAGATAGPLLWNAAALHFKAVTDTTTVDYQVTGR